MFITRQRSCLFHLQRSVLSLFQLDGVGGNGYLVHIGHAIPDRCRRPFARAHTGRRAFLHAEYYIAQLMQHASSVFPRKIPPHLWAQIVPGVNNELAVNMVQLQSEAEQKGEHASNPSSDPAEGSSVQAIDAPLVRAFNLLRKFFVHEAYWRRLNLVGCRDAFIIISTRNTDLPGLSPSILTI